MPEAIERYHRVDFPSVKVAASFLDRLLTAAHSPQGVEQMEVGPRPVAFAQLESDEERQEFAYLSDGAILLSRKLGLLPIDQGPVALGDLPDGLVMFVGTPLDATEYDRRGEG